MPEPTRKMSRVEPGASGSILDVTSVDGCRIRTWVQRSGPPLCVCIHGAAEGRYVWSEVLSRMPGISSATIDLRGHGDSDWDPRSIYRLATHADDVSRVISALGAVDVQLIGHSLGAAVAMQLASVDRRVRKLVIVDFGPGMIPEGVGGGERAVSSAFENLR